MFLHVLARLLQIIYDIIYDWHRSGYDKTIISYYQIWFNNITKLCYWSIDEWIKRMETSDSPDIRTVQLLVETFNLKLEMLYCIHLWICHTFP